MREKFREKKRWGKKDRFRLNPARMSKQVCVVQKAGRFPIRPFYFILFYFILFYFFVFLGLHPQHMEVPRLGTKLELQLPAYTTATVTPIRPFYFIFLLFTAAPASYGASQARVSYLLHPFGQWWGQPHPNHTDGGCSVAHHAVYEVSHLKCFSFIKLLLHAFYFLIFFSFLFFFF